LVEIFGLREGRTQNKLKGLQAGKLREDMAIARLYACALKRVIEERGVAYVGKAEL